VCGVCVYVGVCVVCVGGCVCVCGCVCVWCVCILVSLLLLYLVSFLRNMSDTDRLKSAYNYFQCVGSKLEVPHPSHIYYQ